MAITSYTNASKSTLFNRLTDAGALAENRLFATLDSKLRRGAVAPGRVLVFADTVGFIRKLPHHLVSSFRSTLGEIAAADLVIHLVDRSHPLWEDQMTVAEGVLADLGVAPERVLRVFNKSDRVTAGGGGGDGDGHGAGRADGDGHHGRDVPARRSSYDAVWISALTGEGIDDLKAELAQRAERVAAHEAPTARAGSTAPKAPEPDADP